MSLLKCRYTQSDKPKFTPGELARMQFRARCRFRGLVRLVMKNLFWLAEDVDLSLTNVRSRVKQAVQGITVKNNLLSIKDKALLNKPISERTDADRIYLYKKLGGLKCFKLYPHREKRKLAAVTYFKYFGPNRTIVRQHDEAHAMYFIVTGHMIVTVKSFDEILNQEVSVQVGELKAGKMFGEISLLHNINRTGTVTTTEHCELLALMKDDFKNVLQETVQRQWDEVNTAMAKFSYFDHYDQVSRREGCISAKLLNYKANEVILGDGHGVPNHVYFMISGKCQMIESLQVSVTTHIGKEHYKLLDTYQEPSEESDHDLDKYFKPYAKQIEEMSDQSQSLNIQTENKTSDDELIKTPNGEMESIVTTKTLAEVQSKRSDLVTFWDAADPELKVIQLTREGSSAKISYVIPKTPPPEPENIRTYFMQVCIFNPGACFGFCENMQNRRIIARNNVKCLLLPKLWLMKKNPANIWTRIKYYLEKKVPNRQEIFRAFVAARRWNDYRDKVVKEVLSRNTVTSYTTIHDVPYSIRLAEMID